MPKTKAAFTLIAGLILILQAAANVALADDGGRSTLNQRRDSPDNVQVTASAVAGAVKTTPATSQAAVGDMQRPPSLSGETNLSLAALAGYFREPRGVAAAQACATYLPSQLNLARSGSPIDVAVVLKACEPSR